MNYANWLVVVKCN